MVNKSFHDILFLGDLSRSKKEKNFKKNVRSETSGFYPYKSYNGYLFGSCTNLTREKTDGTVVYMKGSAEIFNHL